MGGSKPSGGGGLKRGKKQQDITAKYAGMTLQQAEEHLRTLNHEEAVIFDASDTVTAAYKGGKGSVAMPDARTIPENGTITHSHPDEGFGGTFSKADLDYFLNSKAHEIRATTGTGNGEMNYIMRRGANANAQTFKRRISKDWNRNERKMNKVYNDTYAKLMRQGVTPRQAHAQARQQAVGTFDRWLTRVSQQHGFEYVTRSRAYEYGR